MPRTNLFSTYRQGENRVTGSLLAVLERLDLESVEEVLNTAAGDSATLELVRFALQPRGSGASVPDARIGADFALWFETKTQRNSVSVRQIREHLRNLREDGINDRLIVLTPDSSEPEAIGDVKDPRVLWISFAALVQAFEALLSANARPSDTVAMLVRELMALFEEEGLLTADDTVIVAARSAYPQYQSHSIYVCQTTKSFKQGLTHFGFYADREIKPEIAAIQLDAGVVENTPEGLEELRQKYGDDGDRLANRLEDLIAAEPRRRGGANRVFLLSSVDAEQTVNMGRPIPNDLVSSSGRGIAYTMGQRYASLDALKATAREGGTTSSL